ncbi:hypothetical protein [Mammaliicoccus sciuri]|uniref:hypothetical protein n=1 Tax=Mammaliicoccus sciuri TaxID=1296 RepID=UPI0021D24484|nr:hypothetical protein [Mammaliicoccus sciuri]UXV30040.1 hypothetical protein MUA76_03255 [Mammaliicoccus sciuri]
MTLNTKSKESRKVANLLKQSGDLNTSANRYYYSCFQKLMYFAETELKYERPDRDIHASLINYIEERVNLLMKDESVRMQAMKVRTIKKSYRQIKKYRAKADYKYEDVTDQDMDIINREVANFDKCYSNLTMLMKEKRI